MPNTKAGPKIRTAAVDETIVEAAVTAVALVPPVAAIRGAARVAHARKEAADLVAAADGVMIAAIVAVASGDLSSVHLRLRHLRW